MKYRVQVSANSVMNAIIGFKRQANGSGCDFSIDSIVTEDNVSTVIVDFKPRSDNKYAYAPTLCLRGDSTIARRSSCLPQEIFQTIECYEVKECSPVRVACGNLGNGKCFSIWKLNDSLFNVHVYRDTIIEGDIEDIEYSHYERADYFTETADSYEEAYSLLPEYID